MPIIVHTSRPKILLEQLYHAIKDGVIASLTYDKSGYLTSTLDHWTREAWLQPIAVDGQLRFRLKNPCGPKPMDTLRGWYFAQIIQELITHFNEDFDSISVEK